jgi:hypothetical protein
LVKVLIKMLKLKKASFKLNGVIKCEIIIWSGRIMFFINLEFGKFWISQPLRLIDLENK